MPADNSSPLDLDLDRVYQNYLVTCQRLGIEPTPRERGARLDSGVD